MTSHDIETAMNAHLDAHPGDMQTRRELADLLDDMGRHDEAEGIRWLVSEGKWPSKRMDYAGNRRTHRLDRPWDWWGKHDAPFVESVMHDEFWRSDRKSREGRYATRQEAEADAIAYARRAGLVGKEVPA